ncbi:uncharacterized protein LOC127747640 [Arachis duranensis]|uniref:Uncharacterized protein LOC127747640 n=1 Tax=Arachis duranensis TaxID=130453 RepID=A0A9C6TNW5_ARADU|nr:uncharacterized protein LOC127747640 [Arachis duranensis]
MAHSSSSPSKITQILKFRATFQTEETFELVANNSRNHQQNITQARVSDVEVAARFSGLGVNELVIVTSPNRFRQPSHSLCALYSQNRLTCVNPFLPPSPCTDEPLPLPTSQRRRTLPAFAQRRRTLRPSTSSRIAPANTIVAEPAPPPPPTASFLASRRQHHPATHSIVSGLAETRTAPATQPPSQVRYRASNSVVYVGVLCFRLVKAKRIQDMERQANEDLVLESKGLATVKCLLQLSQELNQFLRVVFSSFCFC